MNGVRTSRRRLNYTAMITLRHWLPNRLRLEVPVLRDDLDRAVPKAQIREVISKNALIEVVESAIRAVEGVDRVEISPITGSLVVEHDGEPGRDAAIFTTLYGILAVIPPPIPKPRLLMNLSRWGMTVDQATLRASKGWIDLETILPLALAIYGFSELLIRGRFQVTPSLMILWRAYTNLRDLSHDPGR